MTGFTGETIIEVKINNDIYKLAVCELVSKVESNNASYPDYFINTPNGFVQLLNVNKLGLQRVAIVNKKFKYCFNLKFLINKEDKNYCEIKHLVNHSVFKFDKKVGIKSISDSGFKPLYSLQLVEPIDYYINDGFIINTNV